MQMREGIFSDEDMNHLENGYSVSDTDDERTHMQDGDIMSLRSGFSSGGGALLGGSPGGVAMAGADGGADVSNLPALLEQARQNAAAGGNLNSEAALVR